MRGTKKIDWLNHFLEFIVVVIGILLAFQLNTCREDKKEQKLVDGHVKNIIAETSYNKKNLSSAIKYSEELLSAIDTLMMQFKTTQDIQKMNMLTFSLLKLSPVYIKKNAYNSLKESGDIRFLKDFEQKNNIITLYEYYNWADGIDQMTMSTYRTFYFPFFVDNFDMINALPQEKSLYINKKFMNIVSSYRYAVFQRITQNKNTLERMNTFLEKNKPL